MIPSDRPELPKRFYETVSVEPAEGGFAVLLDGRPIRTPGRRPLVVPRRTPADDVAAEWQAQEERIDPATMPMTRLVNTVIDGILVDPAPVVADLGRYAETDLLFYRAGEPERLAERQRLGWDPVLAWAEGETGRRFVLGEGVMHVAQPPETVSAVRERVDALSDAFTIAGLHQMTTLTGSLILSLAVVGRRLSVEEAWSLAHLDEDWNIEQWGEDEEARLRRLAREREMHVAAHLTVPE